MKPTAGLAGTEAQAVGVQVMVKPQVSLRRSAPWQALYRYSETSSHHLLHSSHADLIPLHSVCVVQSCCTTDLNYLYTRINNWATHCLFYLVMENKSLSVVRPLVTNSFFLWQDTNRNLTKVDRMLGKYREHTDDQAEAMALVRHAMIILFCLLFYSSILYSLGSSITHALSLTSLGKTWRSQSASYRHRG